MEQLDFPGNVVGVVQSPAIDLDISKFIKIDQSRDSDTELSPWFRLQQEAYFRERASFQLQFGPEVTAKLCRNL